MGFLLRLLVVSLLAVGTSKVNAHVLSMPVEPHFPTGGLSKPHRLPENLNYPLWFSMAPLYLPQQNPDINGAMYPLGASVPQVQPPMIPVEPKYPMGPVQLPQFPEIHPCSTGLCRLPMFPVEPKYPIGGPVPQVQPPMIPVEPKYPQVGPVPQVQPPMIPVEPKYPQVGPVPQVQPPMIPVEPKYPQVGPVPQVQRPEFPVEPKYPMGPVQLPQFPERHPCSTGLCRLPMFPVEPKYPIGGPVPQVQPPILPVEPKYPTGGSVQLPQFPERHPCSTGLCRLQIFPVEPKYPIGGPVPQMQLPRLPGKIPCSLENPVGSCTPHVFHANPNYPLESPSKQRISSVSKYPVEGSMGPGLLTFIYNFEPGKDLNYQLHHGRSPGCESKWPFFPSKPCS